MTRKEAKSRLNLLLNEGKNPYELVDVIYDEFEQELGSLEEALYMHSQETCENCKYSNITLISDVMLCDKKVSATHGTWKSEINKDFGCNQWEKK